MPTPFQNILAAAKGTLRALKGQFIVYDAGDFQITVTARVGKTIFRIDTGEQFNARQRTRDYLIEVDALRHPETGERFLPAEGHRLRETRGDLISVYECLPIGTEPGWRYSDTTETEYRIHTRKVDEEAVE